MDIASVALFFIYAWGLGFSAAKLLKLKESDNLSERKVMRIGLGLGVLVILAMLLNAANVPLDWRVFLALSVAYPIFSAAKNFGKLRTFRPRLKLRTSYLTAFAAGIIFLATLYMHVAGAFSYPWLENDDPWSHASGIKYIATEKTFDQSQYRGFQYMNPYPPAYDFILGLMHQTTESLYWTMKFFNALIVSLSVLFFYFFAKEFTGSRNKALFATAILAAIPAYQSHFIWAPALAMALFFPALYAMEMAKHDKKWKWMAAIAVGALLVSHPTHALTLFAMIAVYALVKTLAEKDIKSYSTAALGGVIASLSWWGLTWKGFFRSNIVPSTEQIGVPVAESAGIVQKILGNIPKVFNKWSGTASRPYTFQDFFVARSDNLINNPIGIGIVASVLFIIGLVGTPIMGLKKLGEEKRLGLLAALVIAFVLAVLFANTHVLAVVAAYAALMILLMLATKGWKQQTYFFITLLWFIISFVIVNNQTFDLPLGFYAFRTWMILAVPVALIAAEGLWNIFALLPATGLSRQALRLAKIGLVIAVLAGVWMSSGDAKYELNTRQWYYSGAFWTSYDELQAYVWMKDNLPANTKVFSFLTDDQLSGMDMMSCGWCREVAEYRKAGFNDTASETAAWMKANGYEYLVLGGREAAPTEFGPERVNEKLNGLAGSGLFSVAHQTNGAIILKTI